MAIIYSYPKETNPQPPGPCISVTTNNVAVIANVGSAAITPASVWLALAPGFVI